MFLIDEIKFKLYIYNFLIILHFMQLYIDFFVWHHCLVFDLAEE